MTTSFEDHRPSLDSYWRAIVLFGRNVASYKFALAQSLLEIAGRERTFIRLDELAEPFSRHVAAHLQFSDKQGTSGSSRFLDACRQYNRGELTREKLVEQTARLGFNNVIDAFHVVNQGEIPLRFFIDERQTGKGIRITDELLQLVRTLQYENLPGELEARWRLVETAWSLGLTPRLLQVQHDPSSQELFIADNGLRRVDITSSRDALNGYQKGKCFYCFADISIAPGAAELADVDHFFPWILYQSSLPSLPNLDGVWNLVLSCSACNRGGGGKFARVPEVRLLERLHRRNSYLIRSHHPLRETLMEQTGHSDEERRSFLRQMDRVAIEQLIHRWAPAYESTPVF